MTYTAFQHLNYVWMGIAALIFLVLLKVTAPYGRHTSLKWGPQISNRLGWVRHYVLEPGSRFFPGLDCRQPGSAGSFASPMVQTAF